MPLSNSSARLRLSISERGLLAVAAVRSSLRLKPLHLAYIYYAGYTVWVYG
jgi:hypothetical protein